MNLRTTQNKETRSYAAANNGAGGKTVQRKANQTGLPDNLKSGIENLSGYSMDDVNVNYHSSKPAQLNAHAYAQGTDIHIAPGQEKHLPHEAWHVVQQKQGRVRPTMQMKSAVPVNDDPALEKEADTMGARSVDYQSLHTQNFQPNDLEFQVLSQKITQQEKIESETSSEQTNRHSGHHRSFLTSEGHKPEAGQMTKLAFLAMLEFDIRKAADVELKKIQQTTNGCPYISYWISYYKKMPVSTVERAINIYSPSTSTVTNAYQVISFVVNQVIKGLQAQLARSPLEPINKEGEPLQAPGGLVDGLTPPKVGVIKEEVAQLGCGASNQNVVDPQLVHVQPAQQLPQQTPLEIAAIDARARFSFARDHRYLTYLKATGRTRENSAQVRGYLTLKTIGDFAQLSPEQKLTLGNTAAEQRLAFRAILDQRYDALVVPAGYYNHQIMVFDFSTQTWSFTSNNFDTVRAALQRFVLNTGGANNERLVVDCADYVELLKTAEFFHNHAAEARACFEGNNNALIVGMNTFSMFPNKILVSRTGNGQYHLAGGGQAVVGAALANVNRTEQALLAAVPIGSRVTFTNPNAPPNGDFHNENTLKIAGDSYTALGFGAQTVFTAQQLKTALAHFTNDAAAVVYVQEVTVFDTGVCAQFLVDLG